MTGPKSPTEEKIVVNPAVNGCITGSEKQASAPATSSCSFCGLPLAVQSSQGSPQFCCFGCRLVSGLVSAGNQSDHATAGLARVGTAAILAMQVMMMSMLLWSPDVFGVELGESPSTSAWFGLVSWLQVVLTGVVLVLLLPAIWEHAWCELARGRLTAELFLSLGAGAAFAQSLAATLLHSPRVYFDVACALPLSITVGRWLESKAKRQATRSLTGLAELAPSHAYIVRHGEAVWTDVNHIHAGDFMRVLPHQRVALDGVLVTGQGYVDERWITGEALPVSKRPGDLVWAGTDNIDGDLIVSVTSTSKESWISALETMVMEALSQRGQWQRAADRIAGWFFPTVCVLAAACVYWNWQVDAFEACLRGLTVIVISCPCALGLATPLVVWSAIAGAAREGILFKSSDALAKLGKATTLFFDKTGTLSTADYLLEKVITADGVEPTLATCAAASLGRTTSHPLGQALASSTSTHVALAEGVAMFSGQGVTGSVTLNGQRISQDAERNARAALGSPGFLKQQGLSETEPLRLQRERFQQAHPLPMCGVGWDGAIQSWFFFAEKQRERVKPCVDALKALGVRSSILSGDPTASSAQLEERYGLAARTGLSPQEKHSVVTSAQAEANVVAMVGDGVNDSPAIAAADIGISMGCGTALTQSAAGLCLLSDELMLIPRAIRWARCATNTIYINLFWAFAYNILGIGLAMQGLLSPMMAAPAMLLSSLFVIRNSLSLPHRVSRLRASHGAGPFMNVGVADQSFMSAHLDEQGNVNPTNPSVWLSRTA